MNVFTVQIVDSDGPGKRQAYPQGDPEDAQPQIKQVLQQAICAQRAN